MEPRKNYPRLVEAHRALRERGEAPELVIAGREGWGYGDAAARLRAAPGVRLLGHVDDPTLAALYRDARAFAFPSLYEGFGLPLLDAMAAGLPSLVGNRGSLPELAGDAALAVDPEDVEAIAAGLYRLLHQDDLRRLLSARGRARAEEFSWERAGAQALSIVEAAARSI